MREEWLAAVAAQVDRLEHSWDGSQALDPGMLAVARDLSQVIGDGDDDLAAWHALGMFYGHRAMARYSQGDSEWYDDGQLAADAFARCFVGGIDVPEGMCVPAAGAAAETARQMLRQAMESPEVRPVTAVARLWQRIIAAVPVDYPPRAGFLRGLSDTLVQRFMRTRDPADLDAAITIGEQAVETSDDETCPICWCTWRTPNAAGLRATGPVVTAPPFAPPRSASAQPQPGPGPEILTQHGRDTPI